MRDGNQKQQSEEGPRRELWRPLPAGGERTSPPGSRDAGGQHVDPRPPPRGLSPRPCPAQFRPHLSRCYFHKFRHICLTVQDAPRAVSSCIPLCTARKCLHKSSPHHANSVWTSLDQSTESLQFLINSGSAPTTRRPKAGRFFPDLPQVSCVFWDVLSGGQGDKARRSVGSTPEARLKFKTRVQQARVQAAEEQLAREDGP